MIHPQSRSYIHDHHGIRERSKQQWTKDRCGKWSEAKERERKRESSLRSCSRNAEDTEGRTVCFSKRRREEGMDEKSTGRINSKMNLVKVKVLNEVRYQCSPLSSSPLAKCAAATLFSRSKG